jgi:hypothetical protein
MEQKNPGNPQNLIQEEVPLLSLRYLMRASSSSITSPGPEPRSADGAAQSSCVSMIALFIDLICVAAMPILLDVNPDARLQLGEDQDLFLRRLTKYYIGARYPEEVSLLSREATQEVAMQLLKQTKDVIAWLQTLRN